jgi:Rrf2 family protein
MHVSKTLDYAVRSLSFIGSKGEGRVCYMKEISEKENIPLSYLAKVMRVLVRDGIVRSIVGPDGGYVLTRKPDEITLMEIYEAVMGRLKIIDCLDEGFKCYLEKNCSQILLWHRLQNSIADVLKNTKLSEIIKRERSTRSERNVEYKRVKSKR